MRLGFVAQRYGLDIAGGAELHCKLVAEHLGESNYVEVFTTCAKDYVTWKNEYSKGQIIVNGVLVNRYPVRKTRNIRSFENIQNLVFHEPQPVEMEERWIKENGPYSPALVKAVQRRSDIDIWILFSYRYWTTVQTLRLIKNKAILVPTAEHDPALYLSVFKKLFHLPRAIAYNSIEEMSLIQAVSRNQNVTGDVIGTGLPEIQETGVELTKLQDLKPYMLYIGRIDKNKGCDHLFRHFRRFCQEVRQDVSLVLIGRPVIPIPDHPGIRYLGYISENEKIEVLRHCRFLIMPSRYESLSMVLLEAWRYHRPALVNGRCEVLKGQCLRANGGLSYENYDEFAENSVFLLENTSVADTIGTQGHRYYNEHYQWAVIKSKYEMLIQTIVNRNGKGSVSGEMV
jgi:glycosyltransferase involved in cell wall biosynthesis